MKDIKKLKKEDFIEIAEKLKQYDENTDFAIKLVVDEHDSEKDILLNWVGEIDTSLLDESYIEFDPIAFRCDYSEYDNLKEVKENYQDIKSLDDLRDHTTVIEIPDSERLIIQAY